MKRLAKYLYDKWGSLLLQVKAVQRMRYRMERLQPGEPVEDKWRVHCVNTMAQLLWILFLGVCGALVTWCISLNIGENLSGIERNEYSEGGRQLTLQASRQDGVVTEHEIWVQERLYTQEEVQKLFEEVCVVLDSRISGEISVEKEGEPFGEFPAEVEGYPFSITWSSDYPEILSSAGKIGNRLPEEITVVTMTGTFQYLEFEKTARWQVRVIPPEADGWTVWQNQVTEALQKAEEKSTYHRVLDLPTEVAGEQVVWSEKKENLALEILLFTLLLGIVVFFLRFQGIREKTAKRDAGLEVEYSTLVTKLTLYLGAGVSIKGAWLSTAAGQWSGKHSYVREEMRLICRELESGVYEDQCYEVFGWRCGRQEYIKLGALLSQNLKKGNSALLQCLRQEVKLAQEQQKHIVRRKGEEASAKLLGPMILLLGMILIVIMVPAFQNIG